MKQDNTNIFVPRVSPKQGLQPTPEKLNAFLDQRKKEGFLAALVNGIGKVRMILIDMDAFEQRRKLDTGQQDLRERMVFGVLLHSRFINDELLLSVTQYQYHLHALASLDIDGPADFIAAAENTMKKLKRGKIDHMLRMVRLKEMVEERRKILAGLDSRRDALNAELRHIVQYIQENLSRVGMLCRKAIVVLVEIGLAKQKESELVKDIRTRFKNELGRTLGVRQLTTDDVAKAKQVVDRLTKRLSELIRDDVYSISNLYEAVHDRAQTAARQLGGLLGELNNVQYGRERDGMEIYQRIRDVLVSLVADYPWELKPKKISVDTTHNVLVMEKRREMVDHLLDQVGIERRTRSDRRSTQVRRKRSDPNYGGPERRTAKDRRTRAGRRAT